MASPDELLARLKDIGQTLAKTDHALALIGLGSVGTERHRLDQFSDLDFFVITDVGAKQHYLDDLTWLAMPAPLEYVFRNTVDGYKVLSSDEIFYEFAIFELPELSKISFSAARVIWKAACFDEALIASQGALAPSAPLSVEWLIGEALTNLYVGLGRYHRGEKLSAMRFIQQHAVDRVLELVAGLEDPQAGEPDPFSLDRRYEQRFPAIALQLPLFMQGYEHSRESARAILDFLVQHFAVSPVLATAIRARC